MKWFLLTFVVAFSVVAGHWYLDIEPVSQILPFSHRKHEGFSCQICHRGSLDGVRAGRPTVGLCAKCHASSPFKDKKLDAVWGSYLDKRVTPWKKIARLPKHVYFSHRRHMLERDIACTRCHGDMQKSDVLPSYPLRDISMNKCIECHKHTKFKTGCRSCHSSMKVSTDCTRCHR